MFKKFYLCLVLLLLVSFISFSESGYMLPPDNIVKMVDAPNTPFISTKVNTGNYAKIFYNALPGIEDVAALQLKLAGKRINPENFTEHKTTYYTHFKLFYKDGKELKIKNMPENIKISEYSWSLDGKYFAFTVKKKTTVELWAVDMEDGIVNKITNNLNCTLTRGFKWVPSEPDNVIVSYVANSTRKAPEMTKESIKPIIQESFGKESKVRTYQDLLKNEFHEEQFTYYFSSIITKINLKTGKKTYLSKPGIYYMDDCSPDGKNMLLTEYKKPYSYAVPYYYFSRDSIVLSTEKMKKTILESHKISDSVPIGGVYTGKRYFAWVPYKTATLYFAEALDGGNPEKEVPYRDKICMYDYPFRKVKELIRLKHRYYGIDWFKDRSLEGMITEYDWKRRWITKYKVDFNKKEPILKVIEDRRNSDEYKSLGSPVEFVDKKGNLLTIYENDHIYTSSTGATKNGYFPVLYRINLNTLEKEELFRCPEGRYDRFLAFTDSTFSKILIKSESSKDYPNYYKIDLNSGKKEKITDFKNPIPILDNVKKELVKYKREDGVELSAMLYYPINYKKGTKVPAVMHAYPLEYSDKSTAGQVRSSSNKFTKISYTSILFFLTQGIAVFKDTQFPVVGDPKTMNDTFIEQLKMNARAAVSAMDNTGVIDTNRLACIGHSYGAFMVANLLIHTDLFKTGIAQSGAYNRTLTPFGFQSERRTFWEAPDTYFKVSPFMHADELNEPILIVHGENDNNPGTFPIQSDRLFGAIKGNGGNVRYLKLPYESHGYSARESILHLLYERYEWAEKYLKK